MLRMPAKLGLTMRIASPAGYVEPRDCLAQDWARFMRAALPEARWLPVPNLGVETPAFAEAWGLTGLILTGGDDPGVTPLRDASEQALLHWALARERPVLGVCRGLHMLQLHFGGALRPCEPGRHVRATHTVRAVQSYPPAALTQRQVNSFHAWAVSLEAVAAPLQAFAATEDGWAEGLFHPQAPVAAVQWHPERSDAVAPEDVGLLRALFGV